ncbi:hypothetical protein [Terrimonas pollutisoli]|uniref:hypothetical protein n=1 Tax=Terrimonas pollutisoli TaxID=3034147 RepID=UPI0023EC894A|nr:hypothetical protein [Terrimonas sp. H1YJ31]
MKKSLLTLSLSLIVISMASFASPTKEEPKTVLAFNKMFTGATHVKWTSEQDGYSQVAFIWGDHRTIAFFDANAKFVGSIRGIFFKELPLSVIRSANRIFNDPLVLQVSEIYNEEGIRYSMEIEYKHKLYNVKFDALGSMIERTRIKR